MAKVDPKYMSDILSYCKMYNIDDVDLFVTQCFKQGFDIKKYGLLGKPLNEGEKHLNTGGIEEKQVEIEVIREIRVEVPIEVIKEVTVERVVEKIIQTSDDTQVNELLSKIEQLNGEISIKCVEIDNIRQEFSTKMEEMENIFQNKMSKKDKELDELRRNLDIPVTNDKLNMLQQTIQNLNSEIRDLKNKNNDLTNKILDSSRIEKEVKARFHNGSNLNDNLYK
jgi:outer membrane murein-binding lipoprotein Lpp